MAMARQDAGGARGKMCSTFSEANGEDPCGSAPAWRHCLLIEVPTPWESEITDSKAFPAGVAPLLEARPDVRLQAMQPDDEYSLADHSRVMLFSRGEGAVREMARREFLAPTKSLPSVVETLLGGGGADLEQWEQPKRRVRDLLVCTHGSRDICCASNGQATYRALRAEFASPTTRVWRISHTGGHRLAANLIDMPSGRYWSRMTPERARQVVARQGDVAELYGCYRGWPAMASPGAQVAEREAFKRMGWDWTQRSVDSEVVGTSEDGMRERVVVRSFGGDGSERSFEATIRQNGVARSIECLTEAPGKTYPRYEVARFEAAPAA